MGKYVVSQVFALEKFSDHIYVLKLKTKDYQTFCHVKFLSI